MAPSYDQPYSVLLDRNIYDPDNLCEGIDLRRHHAADLEDVGAFRCQEDWRRLVGPLERPFRGGLGPQFSFITVAVPNCIPERMEITSYALEFGFIHDDVIDEHIEDADLSDMEEGLEQGAKTGSIDERGASGKRVIAAQIMREMMAIDPERAMVVAKSWAAGVQHSARREELTNFQTLDEYIPYRSLDVGYMLWHGLVTFGCAITIPPEEEALCTEFLTPALSAASLVNDLFSFEKKKNDTNIQNAVYIIMKEHGCDEAEGRERLKARIRQEMAKFVQIVKDTKTRPDLSDDIKRYIDVMQYTLSGNVVWSAQCPRYNLKAKWNELQMLRAKHGVAKYPATFPPADGSMDHIWKKGSTQGETKGEKRKRHSVDGTNGVNETNRVNGTNGIKKPTISRVGVDSLQLNEVVSLALSTDLPNLTTDVILQPYAYITSMPSNGFRDQAVDSINKWLKTPPKATQKIKEIINILHTASLMLDDLQDNSPLRRGKPSTHNVYGTSQTINSATYQLTHATALAAGLSNPNCLRIFNEEINELYVGQSYDLYWTHNIICPTFGEYLRMVDMKTGGLFRMLTRLMTAESPLNGQISDSELNPLCCLIGSFFQIRNDYQNLVSAEYAQQKGFAEDLDEGKYSFTLIHCIRALEADPSLACEQMQLHSLLMKRRVEGKLTNEAKREILDTMKKTQSLEYTLEVLRELHNKLDNEVSRLEKKFGDDNFAMRLMMEMLKV
ncbi:hypothetical protein COCSADRAFT_130354 [Bipolaris sorokiniana ND90Pr]|uniref:geranylgeranyl diphosphate synthase n=1 Tax=Cochliobolus sativus (strain ND90Pr / ATCC 201652) TaxID=665912 RepID=M2TIJ7_COCSN|nr:uncharacterized protein COCSADRAFT_130354 [Bipolaris sorokiniana ND90Pr]EMD69041.1 hypothetical protein COCSADRAFT_130354 [Bipolaris sorokiniana ND90Pr]